MLLEERGEGRSKVITGNGQMLYEIVHPGLSLGEHQGSEHQTIAEYNHDKEDPKYSQLRSLKGRADQSG